MKKIILINSFSILLLGTLLAKGPGSNSFSFLELGAGGRPGGMAGAYVGLANDINAILYNPAGLSFLQRKEATFMYLSSFQDISYSFIGYGQPIKNLGIMGFGITRLDSGKIKKTNEDSQGNYVETTGNFSEQDYSINLGFGKAILNKKLMLGLAIKGINQEIDKFQVFGWAVDFGVLVKIFNEKIQLGTSILNLGTDIKNNPLPSSTKIGISVFPINNFTFSQETKIPIDASEITYSVGIEYVLFDIVGLRAGYQSGQVVGEGITAGIGLKINNMGMDYSYMPYGELGLSHRLSLTFNFGRVENN